MEKQEENRGRRNYNHSAAVEVVQDVSQASWSSFSLHPVLQDYTAAGDKEGDTERRAGVSRGHGAKGADLICTALPGWSCLKTQHTVNKC